MGQTDRAVEEIIGMVLLIVLVLLGSTVVVVLGASALDDAQSQTRVEAAQHQLQELDARLSTLAAGNGEGQAEFDAGNDIVSDFRMDRTGYLNVTVDHNRTCSFQQELTSVVFEDSQGRTVGYEAGGVWRAGLDGSTTISPPDVTFEGGTLDVQLVNITGHIDQATNVARLNVTATRNRTQSFAKAVRTGTCVRPDNVTIWVKSRFQTGWHNYLESEIGVPSGNVRSFSNGTVKVFIPQNALHPSVDDRTNHVINLSHDPSLAPYMENVTLEGRPFAGGPVTVNASKEAGNTYSAFIAPLTDDSLDIGREIDIEGANVTGPPLDVVMIMDESGSMEDDADPACSSGCDSKTEAAVAAAKNFVGDRNESRDRIGIVGYDTAGRYHLVNGMYFSGDFDAVNDTFENAITNDGGTRIDRGLNHSNAAFDLKGNESRRKVTILLTDGRNNACSDSDPTYDCSDNVRTLESAWRADNASVTVYTIGFGGDVRDELLRDVAQATGGKYYPASNSDELEEAFENISKRISPQNAIASTPITSNITAGGQIFDADIPGDTNHIASVSSGSETFLNINDPTAPSLFSHSFPHADDEDFGINLTRYDCKPGHWNLTGQTRTVNGSTVSVARCTDIGATNGTFGAEIYVDGERPDTLLATRYASWQTDVNQSLTKFPSVSIDSSTGILQAQSNQAIIAFDLPPEGSGTRNTLALLVQIGLSDTEAAGEDIVSIRVAQAELQG